MVRWPGRIPAGRVSPQMAATFDWSASILAAAGVTPPANYDGMNLIPILAGQQPVVERTFFWRAVPGNRNQRAVRKGDWKLIVDVNHIKVFNVREDPGEHRDLTRYQQAKARELMPLLNAWTMSVNADQMANEPEQATRIQQQLGGRGAAAGGAAGGRGGAAAPAGRGGAGGQGAPAGGGRGRGVAQAPASAGDNDTN
jgi:arylsulfatase A-like enzyme